MNDETGRERETAPAFFMPTAGKAGKYAKAEETNMAETVKQEANAAASAAQTTPAAQPGGKTFTQAELDAIVADRLARERAKYPDYESIKAKAEKYDAAEEAGKSELQKANERAAALKTELDGLKKANQLRELRASVAKEKGVPEALLTGETEEACKAQADAISSATTAKAGGVNYGAIEWDAELQIAAIKEFLKGGHYLGDASYIVCVALSQLIYHS